MYELEQVFQNTAFVINFIIQIILLIVFLCLAWNVSKIRKTLSKDDDSIMISDARRMVFKGDQSKAIDIYYDLLYYYRFQYNPPEKQMKIDKLKSVINELTEIDAEPPESIKDYIQR